MGRKYKETPYACFDFDGTIVDSNWMYIEFVEMHFKKQNMKLTDVFLEKVKTMGLNELCNEMSLLFGGNPTKETLYLELEKYTLDMYMNRVELKKYVFEYLEKLYMKNVKMCIVSSTAKVFIDMAMKRLELEKYFISVVTPEQVGNSGKEKPEIFYEAAHRLGIEDMSLITMYDDSFTALETAHKAGMQTVAVYDETNKTTREKAMKLCEKYILSFAELL